MPASIETKKLPASRTQCLITFTTEETAKAEDESLRRLAATVRIPGFRPGKAPADLVREKIEASALLEETVRSLLGNLMKTMIEEQNLHPILPPTIEIQERSPVKIAVTFVEKPEVKLKGADKIKIEKKESKVDAKDVDRMIKYLQDQEKVTAEVERKAKEGDQVTMDFVGTDAKGVEVPGTRSRGYQVIIGSKSLLPGFEDALIGMSKDEEKSFPLTFPTDYHAEQLRGKPVTFAVKVSKVEEVTLPEMTDAYVREHDMGKDVADLRSRIEASMKTQEESIDQDRRERELFDAIRKATVVDLAPELLEQAEHSILHEHEEELTRRGMTLEQWLQRAKKSPEDFGKEIKEQAKNRLTVRFGIETLLEERKIAVTDDELQQTIDAELKQAPAKQLAELQQAYAPGSDAYAQLKWRKEVEKLTHLMLAA